jgi:hypothetical protein
MFETSPNFQLTTHSLYQVVNRKLTYHERGRYLRLAQHLGIAIRLGSTNGLHCNLPHVQHYVLGNARSWAYLNDPIGLY